jgi:F0F1-type ATP synthase assembly protein I
MIKEMWDSLDARAKKLVLFLLVTGVLGFAAGVLMIWKSLAD